MDCKNNNYNNSNSNLRPWSKLVFLRVPFVIGSEGSGWARWAREPYWENWVNTSSWACWGQSEDLKWKVLGRFQVSLIYTQLENKGTSVTWALPGVDAFRAFSPFFPKRLPSSSWR